MLGSMAQRKMDSEAAETTRRSIPSPRSTLVGAPAWLVLGEGVEAAREVCVCVSESGRERMLSSD